MSNNMDNVDNLRAEYSQVCENFRLLTDIRFKLLAFLPIGTGAGIAYVTSGGDINKPLIGTFGLVITIALATYNSRNDQLYNELIGRAAQLERLLGIKDGGFAHRPGTWLRLYTQSVEHGWPVALIYATSMSAWLYLILLPFLSEIILINIKLDPDVVAATTAVVIILLGYWGAGKQLESRKNTMRKEVVKAVDSLRELYKSDPGYENNEKWQPLIKSIHLLSGVKKEKTAQKLKFYLTHTDSNFYWVSPHENGECDEHAATQLVALLINQSARWVLDTYSGRSGYV